MKMNNNPKDENNQEILNQNFTTKKSSGIPSYNNHNRVRSTKFIIQKYLEEAMLVDDRKFDIRVWVLITHNFKLYIFKEGYLRLASEKFTMDKVGTVDAKYIHLTNNA